MVRITKGSDAKGTKRKFTEAEAAVEKCNKLAQLIADAAKSADVPADVIEMLVQVLPHSLGQSQEQRHRFQEQAIDAVDRVLQQIDTHHKNRIEMAKNTLTEAREKAAPSEKAVTDTEQKLREDTEGVQSETKELAKSALAFRTARSAVEEAKKLQESGDEDYKAAAGKKQKLQALSDKYITPLKSGSVSEADQLESKVKTLQSELTNLGGVDEAMLLVLGSSFMKKPEARGGFDTMAIEQLEKQMGLHMQPVDETLQAGEEGKQQRAIAVQLAQKGLEEALAAQKLRADVFESAWKAQKDDEKALEAAKQALKDLAAQAKSSDRTLYQAEADNEVFQEFARTPFEELKARTTPEPVPEPVPEPAADATTAEPHQSEAVDTGLTLPEAITA